MQLFIVSVGSRRAWSWGLEAIDRDPMPAMEMILLDAAAFRLNLQQLRKPSRLNRLSRPHVQLCASLDSQVL